ncbi:uncharacterized protein LOC134180435 [Corticium candelabrum]|uniref:uncharacterized protein LOC134180435 n=1 Tax=Corticium candelabrum TaxID=121492 RepID=UPI002E259980|nr:uncharacterized protein LOC134180435 [Corticium candelabrum]
MARYIDHLASIDVRLVCIDFDQTLVDVHTEGKWTDTADKLAKRVRPRLKELIEDGLKRDFKLAIVTQSSQTDLIRKVLKKCVKQDTSKIIIRGQDKTWDKIEGVARGGKQQHIASVMKELEGNRHLALEPRQVLLIDDDSYNTGVAMCFGMRALTFENEECLGKILKLVKEQASAD